MTYRFTHTTTITVEVGPDGGEDDMDVTVRLNLGATLPTNTHLHPMDPDRDDGEVWIETAELQDGTRWETIHQLDGLWGYVEAYVTDHSDELLAEACEDHNGAMEYARDMALEARREERV